MDVFLPYTRFDKNIFLLNKLIQVEEGVYYLVYNPYFGFSHCQKKFLVDETQGNLDNSGIRMIFGVGTWYMWWYSTEEF